MQIIKEKSNAKYVYFSANLITRINVYFSQTKKSVNTSLASLIRFAHRYKSTKPDAIRKEVAKRPRATMTRAALVVILILFSISSVNFVDSLVQDNWGKFLGTFNAIKQYIVPILFSLCAKKKKRKILLLPIPRALCNNTLTFLSRVKIPELLNQLCNQSQGSNANLQRDACYGCFYRASILPQGFSMLAAMSTCADDYLNNTSYGHCQAYLRVCT